MSEKETEGYLTRNQYDIVVPPGYESATYDKTTVIPPPQFSTYAGVEKTNRYVKNRVKSIDESEAKDLFHKYEKRNIKRGLSIDSIKHLYAFNYTLKTQSEKRKMQWIFKPYEATDYPPEILYVPQPWSIPVPLPHPFTKETKTVSVPETKRTRLCHKCTGRGRHMCDECYGWGRVCCSACDSYSSTGNSKDHCSSCDGSGKQLCSTCFGSGETICTACKGSRYLVHYIQLTVEWNFHEDNLFLEASDLPERFIRKVSGDLVYKEDGPTVEPISKFWELEVSVASSYLISKHIANIARNERIVYQSHCVVATPVVEIGYTYQNQGRMFVVYGLEKKVYRGKLSDECSCCAVI